MEAASRSPGNIYFANGVGWQSSGAESNPSRFELSQVVVTPPLTRISILALARPQYTPAPLRTARPFTLNPAHHLCW